MQKNLSSQNAENMSWFGSPWSWTTTGLRQHQPHPWSPISGAVMTVVSNVAPQIWSQHHRAMESENGLEREWEGRLFTTPGCSEPNQNWLWTLLGIVLVLFRAGLIFCSRGEWCIAEGARPRCYLISPHVIARGREKGLWLQRKKTFLLVEENMVGGTVQ